MPLSWIERLWHFEEHPRPQTLEGKEVLARIAGLADPDGPHLDQEYVPPLDSPTS